MKRNRPGAVLLRPDDYARLLMQAQNNAPTPRNSGLDILLRQENGAVGGLDVAGISARMTEVNEGWRER